MAKSTDIYQQFERQFQEVEWLATLGSQRMIKSLDQLHDHERARRINIVREFIETLCVEYLRLDREWTKAERLAGVRVVCTNTLHFPPQS